jgi:hypothetical protein
VILFIISYCYFLANGILLTKVIVYVCNLKCFRYVFFLVVLHYGLWSILYRMRDRDQFQSSTCWYSVFPAPFVEEADFSPACVFLSLLTIRWLQHHWLLLGPPFYSISVSVLISIPCCFCYYGSEVYFEIRYCDTSSITHFVQDCFGYLGFRASVQILGFFSPTSLKNGILIEVVLNL